MIDVYHWFISVSFIIHSLMIFLLFSLPVFKIFTRSFFSWIVESESFPISPAHMCDDCYRSFHYILSYRRNIDSKAYVYMDPSILQY